MSAHLGAASLGYAVWWVTAIGQENAQKAMKPLLGISDELSVLDIFAFGPPARPPYKLWKKSLDEIVDHDRFDQTHFMSDAELEEWIRSKRHKVMFKDADQVD
ncbi:hypothetical protein [Breoghania sp.]|uniref:hypothetical protein n=1 Tax=Breoghania sp. TaxID=2065378 RepID=UPI002615C30C|nr:hypothetical protein [Breoghania sp.]MDJ0931401.1 hypothetical protein [Breoghania sp.]